MKCQTCSAATRADRQPLRRSGKVPSTIAGKVFLLMWPGDFGPFGAAVDVANMREVETSRRSFRHSPAIGRMSLSVSESLAIRRDSSYLEEEKFAPFIKYIFYSTLSTSTRKDGHKRWSERGLESSIWNFLFVWNAKRKMKVYVPVSM